MSEGKPLLESLGRGIQFLTAANLIEHAAPAAGLIVLALMDLHLVGYEIEPTVVRSAVAALSSHLPYAVAGGVGVCLCLGFFLYQVHYYRWFPGYTSRRRRFRLSLGSLFPEASHLPEDEQVTLGKMFLEEFFREFPAIERAEALRRHVVWVALAHMTINIVVSFIVLCLGGICLSLLGHSLDGTFYVVILLHVPCFAILLVAAIKRQQSCNRCIVRFIAKRENRRLLVDRLPELLHSGRIAP